MAIKQNPRIAQAARAAISLVVGLFLTFSQSHGAEIGLLALGIFGLGFAVLNGFASVIFQKGLSAIENVPLTMVALLIGIFALTALANVANMRPESLQTTVVFETTWLNTPAASQLRRYEGAPSHSARVTPRLNARSVAV